MRLKQWIRVLRARVGALFGREQVTSEIHDELRHHLNLAIEDNLTKGMTPADARADAMRRMGNVMALQDQGYDVRGGGVFEATVRDARFALRLMGRQPGFTTVALLTIALGIGATATIFGVAHAVLLKPLPYPDPDRLANVWMTNARIDLREDWHSLPNIEDYRAANSTFEAIAVYNNTNTNLTGAGDAQRLTGARASANLFTVLGVSAASGRVFTDDEDQPGSDAVVVLSHGLWQRVFGGDPAVVGREVEFSGRKREVVGVMPEGFAFPQPTTEFWVPNAPNEQLRNSRNSLWLMAIGRLKPGVTVDRAQADLELVAKDIVGRFPDQEGYGVYVVGYHDQLVGRTRPAIIALLGAVGFLLLIACVNVANLLLSRAAVREREIALRTAIGAGRWRLIRQLLTESTVLAVVGGLLGVAVAWVGLRTLISVAPPELPRLGDIGLNWTVVGFSFAASLVTGLIFGLMPALQISRAGMGHALKEGGRGVSSGVGRLVRRTLVVVQVALALVLLTGAGLMVQSFLRMQRVDLGFDPDRVLTMQVTVSGQAYQQPAAAVELFGRLAERVRALPGVEAASLVSGLFLSTTPNSTNFNIEGRAEFTPAESVEVPVDSAAPGYFETMRVPLLKGREFAAGDTADSTPVVIINETMARRFWPNEDPIGRRMVYGRPSPDNPWMTIVGIVGDTRRVGYEAPIRPETYLPLTQSPSRSMMLVLRAVQDPSALIGPVRAVVRSLDPAQPIHNVATTEELVRDLTAERRLNTLLFALFAVVAAVLAAAGIYGVIAYSVEQRTRELGVRLALGARPREVFTLILREGLTMAVIGIVGGVIAAMGATQVMRTLLYDTSATDPWTYAVMALGALVIALCACLIPAGRAMRVDPLVALRAE
jgi:putative ABC transport system permease protein